MAEGDLVWCDLSAFEVAQARDFYARLFGWSYHRLTQPDGSAYDVAATTAGEAAGLFEMPEKFRKIGLPSFWMPYFAVDDVEAATERARGHGGKVEVEPTAFSAEERIALIRDPLGAGFTVYEGAGLRPGPADARPGHRVRCLLYVSDAAAVRGFYEVVLGWRIAADPVRPGAFAARSAQGGAPVAGIQELAEEIRGAYQFWGLHFAVADLSTAKATIVNGGGEIVSGDADFDRPTILAKDPGGAAFFISEIDRRHRESPADPAARNGSVKWRTVLGLLAIYAAVLFEQNWVWGVLFLLWTIPALSSGETFFVERLSRRANPLLFWLLIATWIVLSLYLIVADLAALFPI